MELVQHEDVHSRQASVLTLKCSWSQRWSVNAITLWLWSANVFATKSVPFECHMDNRVVHLGAEALPRWCLNFYSWVYVTYLFRDLQHHPTSMGWGSRSLRWLIPFSGCWENWLPWSLHPKSVAGVRPHFSPLLMTLTCWLTNDCNLPAPTPTSPLKHTPRAVA